ncbi:Omp28-related outer membrane protein [Cryomorpha ignava]|uniref:Omp28-related outer membrane protein n=1 Tax=Cryomorpha ignava TaxID=101383 RepID=A0A7K3WUA1_9FLAO|nr:Omp28-related outer membrane protein [Cryomorpha ignava]NEN25128.1 Omp28-related outer membrane protein [Cryomorpha ignava]
MKKLFTLLAMTAFVAGANAQLFNDDFESYAAGDYIGVQSDVWTTWSGAVGGAEDAQVVTNQANSGMNSIYFSSPATGNGGPQDVILPFGQVYTEGLFTFTTSMRVANNKQGYFNFQAETTPGITWTIDVTASNGIVIVSESAVTIAAGAYTPEEWFEITIEANLTLNLWKLYIDGELTGTFSNGVNQIASADIFPVAGATFWVDDVSFDWEEVTVPAFNLSAVDLSGIGSLGGPEYSPTAIVRNNGMDEITSFDIDLTYAGGTFSQTITDINLAAGEYFEVAMGDGLILDGGLQTITVEVSNINGMVADDYSDDDIYVLTSNAIPAAVGKRAVVEEGTGTWCQYCPRGAVTMERMSNLYGDSYVGIAVHNNDPMAVAVYDTGLNLNAFPAGKVDRGPQVGDGQFEQGWLQRMQVAPKAYVSLGAQYDEVTRLLEVVVDAEMVETVTGNYRFGLAITEDGVTGVGPGWAQVNFFSGGSTEMGGYEDLPNPVPASMMVYDHVARAILPDFSGAQDIYTVEYTAGETYGFNFSITLPVGWDIDELNLVGMFYAPNNRIDNAYGIDLDGAIANEWYDSGNFVGLTKLPEPEANIKLYPNPSTGLSFVQIDLETAENVSVDIRSIDGRLIASRDYGVLATTSRLPVNTENYAAGIYMVQIKVGNTQKVLKLLVD